MSSFYAKISRGLRNHSPKIFLVTKLTIVLLFVVITEVNAAPLFCDTIKSHSAQSESRSYDTLGNGAVKIMIHLFTPGQPRTLSPKLTTDTLGETYIISDKKVIHVNQFTINGDKLVGIGALHPNDAVFKDDKYITTLHAEYVHFKYLIDWQKRQVCVFDSPMPVDTIYKMKLADMTFDFVYRNLASVQEADSLHLSDDRSVKIAGHTCSSGTGVIKQTGEKVNFYYTYDSLGIISPLNAFILPMRHVNVMAVFYKVSSLQTSGESTMLFKIDALINQKFDDKLFRLPQKANTVSVSSVEQITKILSDYNLRKLKK